MTSWHAFRITCLLEGEPIWWPPVDSTNKGPVMERFDFLFFKPEQSIKKIHSICRWFETPWAPSQYPKRRLFVRSREVSKPRDWYFKLSHRFEIWQAHRQQCCRSACQISERSDNSKYKSRGFETSRDLTKRRLFGYWDGALILMWHPFTQRVPSCRVHIPLSSGNV